MKPARTICWAAAILVAAAFGAPMLLENSGSPCGAFAMRAIHENPVATDDTPAGLQALRLFGASIAAKEASKQFPSLPPGVGCAVLYWALLLPTASHG